MSAFIDASSIPPEAGYVLLLFALFVLSRVLLRYRIPKAITSLALGFAATAYGLFTKDTTVDLLATFGIVSLFLFAGLDVNVADLRKEARIIVQHLAIQLLLLALVAWLVMRLAGMNLQPAALVALALLSPSAGFILGSLDSLEVSEKERFWIRTKAIATELVALGVLFVALQSDSAKGLTLSAGVLVAMILLLPLAFRLFATWLVPHAPKSEFAFLMMVAVACALVTRQLGVYYLVGAFVVGIAARRFEEKLPAIASERMLHAVEAFASLFIPFYFFHAGQGLKLEYFSWNSLLAGAIFLGAVPLRFFVVAIHRRIVLGEPIREGARVSLPMVPTLVFTLVIAAILKERFAVADEIFSGLMVYTVVNTLLPGFFLTKKPFPELGPTPELLEKRAAATDDLDARPKEPLQETR